MRGQRAVSLLGACLLVLALGAPRSAAALPLHRKIELARFLQGPQLQVGGCGWQIQCCLVWQTSTAGGQAVGTAAAASSHSNCSLHLAVACAYLFRPACPAPPLPCRATGSPTC
jgi:hypothetical protein